MIDITKEAKAYQIELFQLASSGGAPPVCSPKSFPLSMASATKSVNVHSSCNTVQKTRSLSLIHSSDISTLRTEQGHTNSLRALPARSSSWAVPQTLPLVNSPVLGARYFMLTRFLIPDPVYPWLEDARQHERFRNAKLLQEAHAILHLKGLVDADLPHCPVFVFPSFENGLEREDDTTKKGIDQLIADVFAYFVDPGIGSVDDAYAFANTRTDDFIQAVERHALFVPPAGTIGEPVTRAMERYDDYVRTWRERRITRNGTSLPQSARN